MVPVISCLKQAGVPASRLTLKLSVSSISYRIAFNVVSVGVSSWRYFLTFVHKLVRS